MKTGDGPPRGDAAFTARGICKRYQAVQALDDVDIDVRGGEVHALLGQNGAGKSTLVRILAGAERADAGKITVGGEVLRPGEPNDAAARRIAYVSQEGNLNPYFTVPENVFLGRELTTRRLLDNRRMRREVQRLIDEFGLELDLDRPVAELDPAKRKLAELARALALRPRLLILDEPTAALPQPDVHHLLATVRRLAGAGIGVLFISHYLEEVFDVATRVTVLRDGRRVHTGGIEEVDADRLVSLMIGQEITAGQAPGGAPAVGEPVLVAEGLATGDGVVKRADLAVHPGRVLGIFGVVGAGKSELLEALFGMRPIARGRLTVSGRAISSWGPRQAIAAGLALVPEDRLSKALLVDRSIAWNVAMPYWSRVRLGRGIGRHEARIGGSAVSTLGIRASGPSALVSTLSGGNKQKVSIGRWLGSEAKARIFLFDEPSQGLDVGAREEVYELMHQLARGGAAVVVASSDLKEILRLAHDVVAVRSGTTLPLPEPERTADSLLSAAT